MKTTYLLPLCPIPPRWLVALLAIVAVHTTTARTAAAQKWADWRQARPFTCRADFSLSGYEPLLVELQQVQHDLVAELGVRPATEPIEIYLFQSKPSYQSFMARHHPEAPARRALYMKNGGPGRVFAYRSPEFDVDLRHETTHALLHAALPMVPLWLDEGLAEYFEVPAPHRAHDPGHLSSLRWNIRFGLVPKLTSLEHKHELSDMGHREYVFAWAWVHFMLHGPAEARQELGRFLNEIQHSVPPEPLSRRLARRLPGLEKRFAQHFRDWGQ